MGTFKKILTLLFLSGTIVVTSLFFLSCQNKPSELTPQQKETAKKEISDIGKYVIKSCEQLDINAAKKPYLNSPDFIIINPDGSYLNFQEFLNANTEAFKQFSAMKQETIKEDFRFLTKTQVLYTWFGKTEIELKSGEKMKFESYIGTMLFSKINNEWKIAYVHESASSLIQEQPKK